MAHRPFFLTAKVAGVPAEAIHLTALHETVLSPSDPPLGEVVSVVRRHRKLARFGAVLVNLPYYDAYAQTLARRALGIARPPSRWGEMLHRTGASERVLAALLTRVRDGRASWGAGGPGGDEVLAVALGHASHLAVDDIAHPMIHRIARARSRALGTTEDREHELVETTQSAIFHERYHGRDAIGTARLLAELDVEARDIVEDDRWWRLIAGVMTEAFREAPSRGELGRWVRGYRQRALLLASPLGRLVAPRGAREEAFEALYLNRSFDFEALFMEAQRASKAKVEEAYALGRGDG